jgi:hypothetical protein
MRDIERIYPFLEELGKVWKEDKFQDWRFGQFMYNFLGYVAYTKKRDPFYLEEEQFIQLLKEYSDEV